MPYFKSIINWDILAETIMPPLVPHLSHATRTLIKW